MLHAKAQAQEQIGDHGALTTCQAAVLVYGRIGSDAVNAGMAAAKETLGRLKVWHSWWHGCCTTSARELMCVRDCRYDSPRTTYCQLCGTWRKRCTCTSTCRRGKRRCVGKQHA